MGNKKYNLCDLFYDYTLYSTCKFHSVTRIYCRLEFYIAENCLRGYEQVATKTERWALKWQCHEIFWQFFLLL